MNPWITPMWIMLGVMLLLNALQYITMYTSALLPVSGVFAAALIIWVALAVKATRYDK